jgi:hydantoinase/carbamoylase family amidase
MATIASQAGHLTADVAALARIGADGQGVSRFAWSDEQMEASRWLVARMSELGLDAEIDAAGNVVGRWPSADAGPALVIGSHIDTVPRGGRYDGALGVLAGLEAIRRLKDRGFVPRRPVWLVAFNDEEGARFGTAMLGSRAFCGEDVSAVATRTDDGGVTVAEAMERQGFDARRLGDARAIDDVAAYLELHIEQGPLLEARGCAIGAVTAVAGVLGLDVHLRGDAGHAGTTPVSMRRDALVSAARAITGLRDLAVEGDGVIVTVGTIAVEPGGFNVIPGACRFSVDVRAADAAALGGAERAVRALVARAAAEDGLEAEVEVVRRLAPAAMDPALVKAIAAAARSAGASVLSMLSGAGHDAMVLARHVPAGMLFVPSRDGVSHNPREHTSDEHCLLGAEVLARTVEELDGCPPAHRFTEETPA